MGRDATTASTAMSVEIFQSTRPSWGATCGRWRKRPGSRHFNPRAPHGARPSDDVLGVIFDDISIHAPLMGRDSHIFDDVNIFFISIHAPLMGRD